MQRAKFSAGVLVRWRSKPSDNFEQLWTILRGKNVPARQPAVSKTQVFIGFLEKNRERKSWQGSRYEVPHHRIHS